MKPKTMNCAIVQPPIYPICLKTHNSTAEITLSKITEMCQYDTNAVTLKPKIKV
jgi:hypothetical protein